MELKIFLSSTYLDLKKYRDAVDTALRKQGHFVKKMEVFGARDEEPTEAALSELGKCDIVIGIYAHRYGFIPERNDYSITEQEFWHAKSKNKPIFCFIIDEDYPWPPKMIEQDPQAKAKLNEFLRTIKKEKIVDFFTTTESLAGLAAAAVGRYISEKIGERISTDLEQETIVRPRTSLPYLPYFFGREKELSAISEALLPQTRSWGVLIDGPGGIGKTALAIKSAQEAPDELFDRKIFITAKSSELTPSGTKTLTEYARISYLAMLNELAYELGEDGITKLPNEDRARTLRIALTKQHSLILFDNVENMEDIEATKLYQFLSLLPDGNKAIVTSRRRSDVEARAIRLGRLTPNEVKELIDELAKHNSLLQGLSDEDRALLIWNTGGNPLLIKWVVGQLGRERSSLRSVKDAISFMQSANQNNNPLEFIFGDLVATLSPSEKLVLASLVHLGSASSDNIKWLTIMAEHPRPIIEFLLEELTTRSLINSDAKSNIYYLPTVTANSVRSSLPDAVILTSQRLVNYVLELATNFSHQKDYKRINELESDWSGIATSLPFFVNGTNKDLQFLCETFEPFLKFSGRWDELLWILNSAKKKALDSGDYSSAGMRAFDLALLYSYRGQPKKVLEFADLAKTYWSRKELNKGLKESGLIEYLYGIGHKLEHNYTIAIKHLNSSLETLRAYGAENSLLAKVLAALADTQIEFGSWDDAEHNLSEALRIAENNDSIEDLVVYKGSLAELALAQADWVKADELARSALSLAEQIGEQEEIARNNYSLAQALLKQGFPSQAYSFARISATIYTKLRHKYLPEAQEMILTCKERMKQK